VIECFHELSCLAIQPGIHQPLQIRAGQDVAGEPALIDISTGRCDYVSSAGATLASEQ
jgi:hypothetical protein